MKPTKEQLKLQASKNTQSGSHVYLQDSSSRVHEGLQISTMACVSWAARRWQQNIRTLLNRNLKCIGSEAHLPIHPQLLHPYAGKCAETWMESGHLCDVFVCFQSEETDWLPWLKKACKALEVLIDMFAGEAGLFIFKIHVCTFAFYKYQRILDTFLFTLCFHVQLSVKCHDGWASAMVSNSSECGVADLCISVVLRRGEDRLCCLYFGGWTRCNPG